jgi:hypothetical protein
LKVIERLRPSMSVGLDRTPRFIIKGYSTTFSPLHKYIFHVSLWRVHFSTQYKNVFIVPVFFPLVITDRILF